MKIARVLRLIKGAEKIIVQSGKKSKKAKQTLRKLRKMHKKLVRSKLV